MQRGRDGNFYRFFFKKSSDDRNEPLDAEVYANAAEQIYRPNYAKLQQEFSTGDEIVPRRGQYDNPDAAQRLLPPKMSGRGGKWMSGFGKI